LMDLRSKFRGALIGAAVGDTLGMPVEGWSLKKIRSELGEVKDMLEGKKRPAGKWTDDTAMTIAVAESLIESKGFNAEDMREKFIKHYDPKRGYGRTVKVSLGLMQREVSEEERSRIARHNGAAMRIAPVGLFYYDDPVKLRQVSYESSKITHWHIYAQEGAALQAYAIAYLVKAEAGTLKQSDFLARLKEFVNEDAYKEQMRKIGDLIGESRNKPKIVKKIGNNVEAEKAVPVAIYSFITHCECFKDTVLYAVNLGGDADTIASMAGALSGAYLGVNAIPEGWRNKLEDAPYFYVLSDSLHQLKMSQHKAE